MPEDTRVKIFKALADKTRLELVRALANCSSEQKSCGDLSASARLSQPAMSHHFTKLVDAGIVLENKIGATKNYKLNTKLLKSAGINPAKI